MKAAVYNKYGSPEVVSIADVPKPIPTETEVLVRVMYSTVNRTDCGFRSAEYFISRFFSGLFYPKNKILGNEFSGIVEATGSQVTTFKPGDKVFGYNEVKFGCHAEYLVMNENSTLTHVPDNISLETAAAATEGSHYAWCDIRAAKITSGQLVLVNGTTGAIGSAAVQLLKHIGAVVTAVCHTKHIELVKSLGADEVIDYAKQDFTKLDKKFDVVFDAVGKSSFGKCKPILKSKGIYMSTELGVGWQNPFLAIITPWLGGKKVLFPLPAFTKSDVLFLQDLLATRKFKPVIDCTYTLDNIVEAHKYVETGFKTGNVLIQIGEK